VKVITLWQPWASLIAEGVKTIETRPKQHPWRSAIGQTIAIHAATRPPDTWDYEDGCRFGEIVGKPTIQYARPVTRGAGRDSWHYYLDGDGPFQLPLGAVVATCTLVDVVPIGPVDACREDGALLWTTCVDGLQVINFRDPLDRPRNVEAQRPFGDFTPGRWALLLDNVRRCAPFPCKGNRGLWTLPDNVADNLMGWAA
jgi:hypothetical protein